MGVKVADGVKVMVGVEVSSPADFSASTTLFCTGYSRMFRILLVDEVFPAYMRTGSSILTHVPPSGGNKNSIDPPCNSKICLLI